ncbi:electron transfer flavoprotein beta-subunit [Magnetococcus marinus MC-1]|uniref:Electron transfer flavoprotein subunit beta n=1 Tax=Magnetococcus marinus (strain ATCC BAA-1437 / JCM 17883 / MC-1) TaxID=156889 RepID=A0L505_MAGMM|nr:electron transfer flavoprotein subunit beta/FixA family protein [Magnetococcus marinus]ABK43048.1 electron transfer flavoprotein beta-subunit [Magnetococcus marinus MC-1]
MNILVPIKQVADPATPIRWYPDGGGVDASDSKAIINPFDEIALEAALQLKEAGHAQQVICCSIGPECWNDALRTALAIGADRAIRLHGPADLEPLVIARLLAQVVNQQSCSLVIAGKQAVDQDDSQVGQLVAGLLGWSQATFAAHLAVADGELLVQRETDDGQERLSLPLPAVITTDLRLNTPRYASLPNIVKAKRKPLEQLDAAAFGVDLTPQWQRLQQQPPPMRPMGQWVDSVEALHAMLRKEGLLHEG